MNRAEGYVDDIVNGKVKGITQQNMYVFVQPLYRGDNKIPEGFVFAAWGADGADLIRLYFPNTC